MVKSLIGEENWDDRMQFKRNVSACSCNLEDIQAFIYGGFHSRFWMYRKHINMMDS